MPDTDIAAAARRVAADIRMASHADALSLPIPDLLALLPVLDAVGAEPGVDRLERGARELCRISDVDPDLDRHDPDGDQPEWMFYKGDARAAIALAEAERAAEPPAV